MNKSPRQPLGLEICLRYRLEHLAAAQLGPSPAPCCLCYKTIPLLVLISSPQCAPPPPLLLRWSSGFLHAPRARTTFQHCSTTCALRALGSRQSHAIPTCPHRKYRRCIYRSLGAAAMSRVAESRGLTKSFSCR